MQPIVGIELDDKSHQREDRRERDAFVDGVFAAAKLPLLHVPVKRAYVVAEVAALVAPYLSAAAPNSLTTPEPVRTTVSQRIKTENPTPTSKPTQSGMAITPEKTADSAPRCPKCGSEMTIRTAKSGANAGGKFWGCSTYPACRGMMSIRQG